MKRSVLGLVFLTAFLDLVGFSVIFPLFPAILDHYLALEGPESLVGRLVGALGAIVGGEERAEFAVATLFGGVLGSLYSFLQFLAAPFWGALSDRIGRRPTLLVTLAGTAASYLAWGFAGSFAVLVAARFVGGAMAGNLSTISAVVADTTTGRERAKGMGALGAAIGLGFLVGPAIGAAASTLDVAAVWPGGAALGINPFSAVAFVAFGLAGANFLWALLHFPETRPPEREGVATAGPTLRPFRLVHDLRIPGVQRASLVYFLFLAVFSAMEFTLTFLAVERFRFSPRDHGWMFVYVGAWIAIVQGGIVRRIAPWLGEKKVAIAGLALLSPAFAVVGTSGTVPMLFAGLAAMAVGSALAMPCLSALVSRYTPEDRQGLALGSFRSAGALARALGPFAGGFLYWRFGSAAPYWTGAAFLALPLGLAFRLPPVPAPSEAAA
jgi:MFS family permease